LTTADVLGTAHVVMHALEDLVQVAMQRKSTPYALIGDTMWIGEVEERP